MTRSCASFQMPGLWLALIVVLGMTCFSARAAAQTCTASGTEVKVCLPASGATVNNPTHFIAAASTSCAKGISSMGIYSATGDRVFLVGAASIDTFLPLAPGNYTTTVQEWDNCGGSTSTNVPITVASNSVLTYQYNQYHTGANLYETTLTPSNVNSSTFGKLFTYNVTGAIQGQPLYVPNLTISGASHNVVFVTTESNYIYAIDADKGTLLWQDFIDTPVPAPNYPAGISATPFIVPDQGSHGAIYVEARTCPGGGSCTNGYWNGIHKYDLTTGASLASTTISGETASGNGVGSSGGVITFDEQYQASRPALLYAAGTIYAGFGGVSPEVDTNNWHGWLMGFNASTLAQDYVFNTTPNSDGSGEFLAGYGGGMWGGPLASDWGNYIYFSSGNGTFGSSVDDYGDSYVKMYVNGSSLAVADYFTPAQQFTFNEDDFDIGSAGATLLPDQAGSYPHEMVGAGKCGTIYVIDRDSMGGYNSTTDQIIQELGSCPSSPAIGVSANDGVNNYSTPAYWDEYVYFAGINDYLKAFSVADGLLSTSPTSKSPETFNSPGANASVSSNGTSDGIVWIVENGTTSSPGGTLRAYEATNLADEIYNSNQASGGRDTLGDAVHFTPPTIVNGKVYVGTTSALVVYGPL